VVPDFQSLMLPLLRVADDGEERSLADAREHLASDLGLSTVDQEERLPSGHSRFANRVAWAKAYLQQAGLLISTRRGHFQISERGRDLMKTPPPRIDIKFLTQYPEFRWEEFRGTRSKDDDVRQPADTPSPDPGLETPEEAFDAAYRKIRASLASELLGKVKSGSADFFERLVVELLIKLGYGGSRSDAGQAVGRSGDEGIDGVISEDRLGLDVVYLQAKKWEGTVGRPEIQKFIGLVRCMASAPRRVSSSPLARSPLTL